MIFSPKIINNYKLELDNAENVIQSPNSYHNYVERLKQVRSFNDQQKNKEKIFVGSGNNWIKKLTVPKGPSFLERQKSYRSQSFIYLVNLY